MILLVGLSSDATIRHALLAAHVMGVETTLLDLLEFYKDGTFSWNFASGTGWIRAGATRVEFPDSLITGIYARAIDLSSEVEPEQRAAYSSRASILRRMLSSLDVPVVSVTSDDVSNIAKPYHMRVLQRCGFPMPETLLSNSPDVILSFTDDNTICKGVSSDKTKAFMMTGDDLSRVEEAQKCPILLQRRVGVSDIRAHFVGDEYYAEEIVSDAIDYRFDDVPKVFRSIELPADVVSSCRAYMRWSGNQFVGIDFRRDADGNLVILEANPMPGYHGYDKRAGLKITEALFRYLGAAPAALTYRAS